MSILDAGALVALINSCSPEVAPDTMVSLIKVESSGNPYAIAVVRGAQLPRQPRTRQEAISAIKHLEAKNANFSIGLAQINKVNFKKYNVTAMDLINPCKNLQISQSILKRCFIDHGRNLNKALSCYYSGNGRYGFKIENFAKSSYVHRVHNKISAPSANYLQKTTLNKHTIPSLRVSPYSDKGNNYIARPSNNGNNSNEFINKGVEKTKQSILIQQNGRIIKNVTLINKT